jgi:ribosome-binding factor A
MTMRFKRSERVGDLIKMEVAEILGRKIRDPRIGFVTVMAVEVTDDLREAKVFVSILESGKEREKTLQGLESAAGFIRGEVGKRIKLRRVPELTFKLDISAERAAHLLEILERVKQESHEPSEDH